MSRTFGPDTSLPNPIAFGVETSNHFGWLLRQLCQTTCYRPREVWLPLKEMRNQRLRTRPDTTAQKVFSSLQTHRYCSHLPTCDMKPLLFQRKQDCCLPNSGFKITRTDRIISRTTTEVFLSCMLASRTFSFHYPYS